MFDPKSISRRTYGYIGFAAAELAVIVYTLCAVLNSGTWTLHNSISDFGWDEISSSYELFVIGMTISGLLLTISGYGRFLYEDNRTLRTAGLFISLSGIGMMMTALISKTISDPLHRFATMLFIIVFCLAILITCIVELKAGKWFFSICFLCLGLFSAYAIIFGGIYYFIQESTLLGFVMVWYVVKSVQFINGDDIAALKSD